MADRRRVKRRKRNKHDLEDKRQEDRRRGERRRHERVAAEIMVEVETSGKRTYRRTGNISIGGLGFHAPIPFKQGSDVRLRLKLAGRDGQITVKGVVVGTDETGRGTRVKFIDLTDSSKEKLVEHLQLFDAPTMIGRSPFPLRPKNEPSVMVREGLLLCDSLGVEFRLRGTDKVVGREPTLADVVLSHPTISRRHAHIYLQNGRHVISDLASTNGIHFRQKRIHSLVLRDGMVFKIGRVQVQYLITKQV